MSKWDKYNKLIDFDAINKELSEMEQNNNGEWEDVPYDTYEVKVDQMELSESKAGNVMVVIRFKILAGEYKGRLIYMRQVVNQAFQFGIVHRFLRSLDSDIDVPHGIQSYDELEQLLLDIHENIDGKLEYSLRFDVNKKGYNTFEIVDVYEVEE